MVTKKEGNFLSSGEHDGGSWPRSQVSEPVEPDARASRQPVIRDGGGSLSDPRPDEPVRCIALAGVHRLSCTVQVEGTTGDTGLGLRAPEARSRAAAVLYALGSGLPPAIGRHALGGTRELHWPGAFGAGCCCPGALWSTWGQDCPIGGRGRAKPSAGAAAHLPCRVETGLKGLDEGGCDSRSSHALLCQLGLHCASQRESAWLEERLWVGRECIVAALGELWVVRRVNSV